MRRKKQTLYEVTEEERTDELHRAAKLGAEYALSEYVREAQRLSQNLELSRGLVTRSTLARWLGRSESTIDRWNIPVDARIGRQSFYWLPDVIAFIRSHDDPATDASAGRAPDNDRGAALHTEYAEDAHRQLEALTEALRVLTVPERRDSDESSFGAS